MNAAKIKIYTRARYLRESEVLDLDRDLTGNLQELTFLVDEARATVLYGTPRATINELKKAVMPFGKHKNKKLKDVPRDYVKWVMEENVGDGRNVLEKYNLEPFFRVLYPDLFMTEKETAKEVTMTFGKYKHMKLKNVPRDYVKCMAKKRALDDKPHLKPYFSVLFPDLFHLRGNKTKEAALNQPQWYI